MLGNGQISLRSRSCGYDDIAEVWCDATLDAMKSPTEQGIGPITGLVFKWAAPVGGALVVTAFIGSNISFPLGVPMAVIGLVLFASAALINAYAMFTKEMKSAGELGFTRNRDAWIYAGSPAGMDWRIVLVAFFALAASFTIGFGALEGQAAAGR